MKKALVIIPDNNKGRCISKGFSKAFSALSYYVFEKKIGDLTKEEISAINPDVIFVFWTGLHQSEALTDILASINSHDIIHTAELYDEIPSEFREKQKNYIYTRDGKAKTLAPCVNHKLYSTGFTNYKYTITFCGSPRQKSRELTLAKLIYNFGPINIFCKSFDFYQSLDDMYDNKFLDEYHVELYRASYLGCAETSSDLAEIYSQSKINLDLKNENKNFMNYRCLEIPASGGFLLAPESDEAMKCFEKGIDAEFYDNDDDLADKIRFYLKNTNIAYMIATNGRKKVIGNRSCNDTLKLILREIYGKDING